MGSEKEITSLDITEENLRTLREEARKADDYALVKQCDLALSGNADAFRVCLNVIRDARAQQD